MRTLILLIIFTCFFSMALHSQVIERNDGSKCVYQVQNLRNGKLGICRHEIRSAGQDGNLKMFGTQEQKLICSRGAVTLKPVTATHHITFHFDKISDFVSLNSQDTLLLAGFSLTWIDNYTVYGDIPDGYYFFYTALEDNSNLYYILQNSFHVYKDMDTTVHSASATHHVNLLIYDKNGNVLTNQWLSAGDQFAFNIEYPPQYKQRYMGSSYAGFGERVLMISDVSPDIRLGFGKTNVPLVTPYHYYVCNYPILAGINQDTTLVWEPGDYHILPSVYHPSPAFQQAHYAWGYGTIFNDSVLGRHVPPFVLASQDYKYPGTGFDTVYTFTAGKACDSCIMILASGIDHVELPFPHMDYSQFIGPINYINTDDWIILSSNANFPPVAGDYRVNSGSNVNIGLSAPFHRANSYNNVNGTGEIDIYQHFRDQTNSYRNIDFSVATYDIWKAGVHLYHDSVGQDEITYSGQPDVYSLIVNDSNYTLLGKQGYTKSDLTFDLRKSDPNPPSLTAFKVLMCDSLQPQLIHGYPASVKLTAIDHYSPPASVTLRFKEYSDTSWHDLALESDPSQFNLYCGMPYYADLQPVLDYFADSAWVDLEVKVMDSSGNYNTQTMHPAFLVRDALVGIPVLAKDPFFLVYPNPVRDILRIRTDEIRFMATVYNMTGQVLLEQSDCKEINVSGLAKGVYIVKLLSGSNGHTLFKKIVK